LRRNSSITVPTCRHEFLPAPAGAKAYVAGACKKFPDILVEILDLIAEGDRVVVRNQWTGTEAATGIKYEFSGIVIGASRTANWLSAGLISRHPKQ